MEACCIRFQVIPTNKKVKKEVLILGSAGSSKVTLQYAAGFINLSSHELRRRELESPGMPYKQDVSYIYQLLVYLALKARLSTPL